MEVNDFVNNVYYDDKDEYCWSEMGYNKESNSNSNYNKKEAQEWWNLQLVDFADDDDIKRMMF